MDKSDTEEGEDEESEKEESSGSEFQEDQKKGKGKAKIGPLAKAPSDPFVANDAEDANFKTAPLRLRAKSAGKPKKSSLEGHAASYKPVGPSSPKRSGQSAAMRPPPAVSMNNSTGPLLM